MPRVFNILIALLLLAAVWLRVTELGELPGVNGDEAWYGNLAHDILAGQPRLLTPSRIPINPFYVVPVTLTHLITGDSVLALRVTALLSSLAALAVNFWLAQRFFGQRSAVVSTILLAVLPIMIAYSRFGWDTAQMPLAALCVVYTALHAHRSPTERHVRIAWLALLVSLLVHPTALFLAPLTVLGTLDGLTRDVPLIATLQRIWSRWNSPNTGDSRPVWIGAAATLAASVVLHDWIKGSWLPVHTASRVTDFWTLFADLFSGRTIFTFLTGAGGDWRFWMAGRIVILMGTAWAFRSLLRSKGSTEELLSRGLLASLAAFFIAGGPHALSPGYERYAMFLIVPVVLMWTRGMMLLGQCATPQLSPLALPQRTGSHRSQNVAAGPGLSLCVLSLVAFHTHYINSLRETGGTAAMTFRTGRQGLHAAAAQVIAEASAGGAVTVVTSNFHCEQPLRYLLHAHPAIKVIRVDDAATFQQAAASGVVWAVDFATDDHGQRSQLIEFAAPSAIESHELTDLGGKPAMIVIRLANSAQLSMR